MDPIYRHGLPGSAVLIGLEHLQEPLGDFVGGSASRSQDTRRAAVMRHAALLLRISTPPDLACTRSGVAAGGRDQQTAAPHFGNSAVWGLTRAGTGRAEEARTRGVATPAFAIAGLSYAAYGTCQEVVRPARRRVRCRTIDHPRRLPYISKMRIRPAHHRCASHNACRHK
jgi:hypothetical protein